MSHSFMCGHFSLGEVLSHLHKAQGSSGGRARKTKELAEGGVGRLVVKQDSAFGNDMALPLELPAL